MPNNLLRRHLQCRLEAVAHPRVRDDHVQPASHALDLFDRGGVVRLVGGDELEDMHATRVRGGEGVEVGGAVGVASAGEEDVVWAGGDLFGEAKTWKVSLDGRG